MAKKPKPLGPYDPYVVDQVITPVPNDGDKQTGKHTVLSKSSRPVKDADARGGDHVLQAKKPEGAKVIQDHPKNYFGMGGKNGQNGYGGGRKQGR